MLRNSTFGILVLSTVACGGGSAGNPDAGDPDAATPDARVCLPPPLPKPFTRRGDNPRLRAGTKFGALVDTSISDPDVHWDAAANQWRAYFMASRGTAFSAPLTQTIRAAHGSADGATWTLVDPPVLAASPSPTAWDHANTETPSVTINPDAPPARRYLMLYSGANGPLAGQSFAAYAIGAAFSADGVTFTRVPASESPHGKDGLVLAGADVYPSATQSLVADPEVVYHAGIYHAWFSSFACKTTKTTCDPTAFGIAHATSTDGVHWTPAAANPVPSLLRTPGSAVTGGQQPSVLWDEAHCRFEMWLTSDEAGEHDVQPVDFNNTMGVWHATSDDGATWLVNYAAPRDLSWTKTALGEPLGMLTGSDVAARGSQRLMLYVGFDDQQVPPDFYLPDRTPTGFRPGVMALGVATRE
jgi:hypothetical protein